MPEVVYCARHPEVETGLRCSRCDTPICPRCAIQTPVGARCPDCAHLQRLPTYEISRAQYLLAAGVGLAMAVLSATIWALVPLGGFFAFFIAGGMGWLFAEVISRVVNGRRGVGLQIVAGVSMVVAIWVLRLGGLVGLISALGPAGLASPRLSEFLIRATLGMILDPWAWLLIAVGAIVAGGRLR